MKPPRKSDMQRMERLLRDWKVEELTTSATYGPVPVPGSIRSRRIADAEALERFIAYVGECMTRGKN
jgi:hypothetical protein